MGRLKIAFECGDLVWVTYLDGKMEKLEFISMATATGDCWKLRGLKTGVLIYLQNFAAIEEVVGKAEPL